MNYSTSEAQHWETSMVQGQLITKDFTVGENNVWVLHDITEFNEILDSKIVKFDLQGNFEESYQIDYEGKKIVSDRYGLPWVVGVDEERLIHLSASHNIEVIKLPSNNLLVDDIDFDTQNNLWIPAKQDTLWMYDGNEWTFRKIFDIPKSIDPCFEQNCVNHIQSITIDQEDRIWGISDMTGSGENYIGWVYYPENNSVDYSTDFGDTELKEVFIDQNNNAIYADEFGFKYIQNNGFTENNYFAEKPQDLDWLLIDNENRFWIIGKNRNLFRATIQKDQNLITYPEDWETPANTDSLFLATGENGDGSKIVVDKNGTLWGYINDKADLHRVTSEEYLQLVFEPNMCQQQQFLLQSEQFDQGEMDLWKDNKGEIWYKNNQRLIHTGEQNDCYKPFIDLPIKYFSPEKFSNAVSDEEGNIWSIVTKPGYKYYRGFRPVRSDFDVTLKKFDGQTWSEVDVLNSPDYRIHLNEEPPVIDDNGNIWFVYKGYHSEAITEELLYSENASFKNPESYVGMHDGQEWHFFEDLGIDSVNYLTKGVDNKIWVSTDTKLLTYNGRHWDSIAYEKTMPEITKITMGQTGNIWAAEGDTLYMYDQTEWHRYSNPEAKALFDITPDKQKGVWLASKNGGVYYTPDGKEWSHYTKKDGLISNTVQDIEVDGQGVVWFSSPGVGVSRYYPEYVTTGVSVSFDNYRNSWQAFPNPTSDIITVKGLKEEATLEVFDIHGNLATSGKGKSVVVSHLKTGLYILSVTTATDKNTFKFLKE